MLRRLTFANVIALIALFISLGGGVYAASKVNGKKIKNASVAGSKLKVDTLGGVQINESTLGTVPSAQSVDSAKRADSAKTADSAQTLAGSGPGAFVKSGDMRQMRSDETLGANGTISQRVLELGPLTLSIDCERTNNDFSLDLIASTSAASAGFDMGYVTGTSHATNGGFLGATPVAVISPTVAPGGTLRRVGTLIYNDPATTITVPFVVFLNDTAATSRCFFTGTATRVTG